jgi:hypothetical protein
MREGQIEIRERCAAMTKLHRDERVVGRNEKVVKREKQEG